MKHATIIILVTLLILTLSCRKDFSTVESYGNLSFSKDTVYLDTVFTNIGSATYNLKVYNNSSKNISVPKITLANGTNSFYRLNVDGVAGGYFEDINILANDSLYIFIETTIDYNTVTNPIYTDKILFDNGNNLQDVDLVTLVQDATFIYPNRNETTFNIDSLQLEGENSIYGRFLNDSELTFTNEKPYVIYGYAAVKNNKKLTIDAGAKIYFHNNSGLIIDNNGSLQINGTFDNKVVFEGDRLSFDYHDIAGQWGTIWIRKGSLNNEINYTEIKNASIGILIDSIGSDTKPTLKINNSEIYNSASYGMLAKQSNIEANNLVIGSSGASSFSGTSGGSYSFTHCTFANYWNEDIRTSPTVYISNSSNSFDENTEVLTTLINPLKVSFTNCIIDGDRNIEFLLYKQNNTATDFEYNINNCLIQFNDVNENYTNNIEMNLDDTNHYQNNIINGNADFKNTSTNEFLIGSESDAINTAASSLITSDILNTPRTPTIDIGAYQHTDNQ